MKKLYKSLLAACALSLLVVVGSSPAYAGTIQHKFMIEMPNGDKETLPGGPVIHSVFQDNSGGQDKLFVSDYCWYKGKGGDDTEHMSRLGDGYQCVTPSGCDYSTWHSPIFPAGFNKSGNFYVRTAVDRGDSDPIYQSDVTETSFATFDPEGKTFTERYPWAAQYFDANDPLGGGSFYWKGEAQSGSDSFRIIDGTKPSDTTKGFFDASKAPGGAQTYLSLMDQYWPKVLWRKFDGNNPAGNDKSLGSYDAKSVGGWSNGAILYNSVGQNVLHGSVTWVLKNNIPSTPPEIPWTSETPVPSPGTSPMCLSVELLNLENQKVTDLSNIQVGDSLRAQCGEVAGNNMEYKMRIVELDSNGNQINETVQPPTSGRISLPYAIPNDGRFVVQCAICPNGQCQEFESLPGATFRDSGPDPVQRVVPEL